MFVRLHILANLATRQSLSTVALILPNVVRMPSASSASCPAAPPMIGPSSVVPIVKAGRSRRPVSRVPSVVSSRLVGPGRAALPGPPGDGPAGLETHHLGRRRPRHPAAPVEAEQGRADPDRPGPEESQPPQLRAPLGHPGEVTHDVPDPFGTAVDLDGRGDGSGLGHGGSPVVGRCGTDVGARGRRRRQESQPLRASYTCGWLRRSKWPPLTCSTSAPGNISRPRRALPVAEG